MFWWRNRKRYKLPEPGCWKRGLMTQNLNPELDDGKVGRPWIFNGCYCDVKTIVSCIFSLQPIDCQLFAGLAGRLPFSMQQIHGFSNFDVWKINVNLRWISYISSIDLSLLSIKSMTLFCQSTGSMFCQSTGSISEILTFEDVSLACLPLSFRFKSHGFWLVRLSPPEVERCQPQRLGGTWKLGLMGNSLAI